MNSGFCSVSLSQRACGSTGAVSGLIFMYIMGLCFTPSSLSTQIQHLAMLSFVLVCGLSIFFFLFFFLIRGVGGREGCEVVTLVVGSSNEGAAARGLPRKLAPVYAVTTSASVCQKCNA